MLELPPSCIVRSYIIFLFQQFVNFVFITRFELRGSTRCFKNSCKWKMIWGWFRGDFIPVRCSQVTRVTWEHLTGMKSTVTWHDSNSVLCNWDLNHPQIIWQSDTCYRGKITPLRRLYQNESDAFATWGVAGPRGNWAGLNVGADSILIYSESGIFYILNILYSIIYTCVAWTPGGQ